MSTDGGGGVAVQFLYRRILGCTGKPPLIHLGERASKNIPESPVLPTRTSAERPIAVGYREEACLLGAMVNDPHL